MPVLARKPISEWQPETLTWTTEFNDLRLHTLANITRDAAFRLVEVELKTKLLFFDRTVVRDTDLVCNEYLQHVLADNMWGARESIAAGALLLSIRDDAGSFLEVNSQMGTRRSFPDGFERGKRPLSRIDEFLITRGLVSPGTRVRDAPTAFEDNLSFLLDSSHLSGRQVGLLQVESPCAPRRLMRSR